MAINFFFPELLRKTFDLIENDFDVIAYPRLDLVRKDGEILAIRYHKYAKDQLLIKNDGIYFEMSVSLNASEKLTAYELMRTKKKRRIKYCECCNIHLPYEKPWRPLPSSLELKPLRSFLLEIDENDIDRKVINYDAIARIFHKVVDQ